MSVFDRGRERAEEQQAAVAAQEARVQHLKAASAALVSEKLGEVRSEIHEVYERLRSERREPTCTMFKYQWRTTGSFMRRLRQLGDLPAPREVRTKVPADVAGWVIHDHTSSDTAYGPSGPDGSRYVTNHAGLVLVENGKIQVITVLNQNSIGFSRRERSDPNLARSEINSLPVGTEFDLSDDGWLDDLCAAHKGGGAGWIDYRLNTALESRGVKPPDGSAEAYAIRSQEQRYSVCLQVEESLTKFVADTFFAPPS